MSVLLEQKPLLGKFRLQSTLVIETGLHIGGGGENLDIGGLDKPVIRDPITRHPYIPGSSLKGKLRSILERLFKKSLNRKGGSDIYRYESGDLEDGLTEVGREQYVPFEGAKTCTVSRLFGSTGDTCWIQASAAAEQGLSGDTRTIDTERYTKIKGRNAPARLIVRDCHLEPESVDKLKKIDTGLYMTEWKFENGLDRVTAAANPKQLERVPAGTRFKFEMIYTVENQEQAVEDLQNLAIALAILEDDALGGHGSRGYGKIRFENFEFSYHDYATYRQQIDEGKTGFNNLVTSLTQSVKNTSELLSQFEAIQKLLPEERQKDE